MFQSTDLGTVLNPFGYSRFFSILSESQAIKQMQRTDEQIHKYTFVVESKQCMEPLLEMHTYLVKPLTITS